MAKDPNKETVLDNRFFVPPGVVDVRQAGQENDGPYYDPTTIAVAGPTLASAVSTVPIPPSSYTIIEQRVRISSDGTAVVDVILEFPDTPGIDSIDVRITKA